MRHYANVVATLALFLSLGGGAYAAVTVTGRNVANGTLTGKDVRNETIRSADVRGLRATDFAPGQLPAGPKGDKGDPGPMGPSGPGARVRTTTLQTFASGSTTAVRFNEVEFDTEGAFDDASDRLVAPRAGVYVINAMHTWVSGPASGVRTAWIEVNGTARAMTRDAATTQTVAQNVTTVERLQQGDRVSLAAYQNTGDSLTTVGVNGIGRAYLAFQWVAP